METLNIETTWTPRIRGLTKVEKELLTVRPTKGKMTPEGYNNLLTNKLVQMLEKEPALPDLLKHHRLEPDEKEQLIWLMPGIMNMRALIPTSSLSGYKRKQAYAVHPWSHYLPLWE